MNHTHKKLLPHRNWASTTHLFVGQLFYNTVITKTYVHPIWNLRPMNWQIYYAHSKYTSAMPRCMQQQHCIIT